MKKWRGESSNEGRIIVGNVLGGLKMGKKLGSGEMNSVG